MIDNLSLIDAVMPDIVPSRQQQNQQQKPVVKTEIQTTNGDEGDYFIAMFNVYFKSIQIIWFVLKVFCFCN